MTKSILLFLDMLFFVFMDILSAIFLGFVQGITEFLPISSTGHLILAREFLGLNLAESLTFDVILHLATSLAIFIYFRKEILGLIKSFFVFATFRKLEEKDSVFLKAVIWGTVPAVIVGLLFENYIEDSFRDPHLVAWALIFGSVLFVVAEKLASQKLELTAKKGFVIGFFQALALIPGISRSGSTISGGLLLGLKREEVAKFSFILAFPIIIGSGLKKIIDVYFLDIMQNILNLPMLLGFLSAFAFGLLAIHFLMKYLKSNTLMVFVVYRMLLAALVFLLV